MKRAPHGSRKPRATNAPPAINRQARMQGAAKTSEVVYRDLRHDIVTMTLAPGTPVLERDITQKYGISRTPVREAVIRLTEEGLLDVVPQSGTFVARIPLALVREALVARRALEGATVRAATAHASESQIMEMRALIQRQQEMADAGKEEAFHRADEDFHAHIAASGGLPGLWQMIQQVRVQVERYRRLTLPQPGRMGLVVQEHLAVLEEIARRDADAAVERMNEHLDKLQLDIAVFRDRWPDYFIYDPDAEKDLLGEQAAQENEAKKNNGNASSSGG